MNQATYISVSEPNEAPVHEDNPEETNDTIYCKALAQTLHHLAPPVTAGFYAPWGRCKRRLLDEIQDHMFQRGDQNQDEKKGAGKFFYLLTLIWHTIFYVPVLNAEKPVGVRYIFVNIDIWEYVGCDYTWAGLVTALLDEIEANHLTLFSTFRAFGGQFQEKSGSRRKKWVLKKWSKIFFFCVSWLYFILVLVVLFLTNYNIGKSLGWPLLAAFVAFFGPFLKAMTNTYSTLKKRIASEMDKPDLSAKLGFMHSVKHEVETITKFLQLMSFLEDKEIRLVLKITNLDRCTPDKVVSVLDAMNILLSSKDAPFISILAADPSILVECIQWSYYICSNGYLYLDRIVSLPFCLPQMSGKEKSQLLKTILKPKWEEDSVTTDGTHTCEKAESSLTTDDIRYIFQYLSNENFNDYVPGNSIQMKRVVNTVLTILTMIRLGFKPRAKQWVYGKDDGLTFEEVIDWVILANCWPCRLSWIFLCDEDELQQKNIKEIQAGNSLPKQRISKARERRVSEEVPGPYQKGLLEFYEENAWELDMIKHKVKKLLELDGDPDLFRVFLQKSYFTVGRARYFADLLINLDFSLKRKLELLRDLDAITRRNKSTIESPSRKDQFWEGSEVWVSKQIPPPQSPLSESSANISTCRITR